MPWEGGWRASVNGAAASIQKVNVIFHSIYGHIYKMAEAIAEGAREVEGAETFPGQYEKKIRGLYIILFK